MSYETLMSHEGENVLRAFGSSATRGILTPGDTAERVRLARYPTPPDLAPIVERLWWVRWDLGDALREQETLPFPCVNAVVGSHQAGVHGPSTRRFVARLTGSGEVWGIKFRPGGFHALRSPSLTARELVDNALAFGDAFAASAEAAALTGELLSATAPDDRVELVVRFLRSHHPGLDADSQELNALTDVAREDPSILRVTGLAGRAGCSVRTLERLFRGRIGVSPKWVIRRFRVQEAAGRLATGVPLHLADLAQSLGYFDQSHFIRDFRAQVGRTPSQYAALCATST